MRKNGSTARNSYVNLRETARETRSRNGQDFQGLGLAWSHAWRYMSALMNAMIYERGMADDVSQTLALSVLESDGTYKSICRNVNREIRALMRNCFTPSLLKQTRNIEELSRRNARKFAAQRAQARGETLAEMGPALAATLRNQPADHKPAYRGDKGNAARWGDYDARRVKARELRASGMSLAQIAAECGYRSASAVHAALKGTK